MLQVWFWAGSWVLLGALVELRGPPGVVWGALGVLLDPKSGPREFRLIELLIILEFIDCVCLIIRASGV